jgi:rhodanese-related sulfurtransferase
MMVLQVQAQYKNDNVLYKTVYPEDLVKQLKANPGYLLLDVRSKGENEDTSSMGLNIGRLKSAKNIDIRQLSNRLNELQGYKTSPVFVYCSHSQRSRRASKMLADSGFTNVYNINGGLTALIQADYGLNDLYETKDRYDLLSPAEFCSKLKNNVYILDVRSDSSYNGTTVNEMVNAMGKIKDAVHIPLSALESSVSQLPKNKTILVVDEFGDGSVTAANLLAGKGFKNLGILFDGISNLTSTNQNEAECKNDVWLQNRAYHILTPDEFDDYVKQHKNTTIIDVRTVEEFNNKFRDSWRNIGHIKNAINIPVADLPQKLSAIPSSKKDPIILYSFSRGDVNNAAASLAANGYTNVHILSGGLFNLRWRAANIKGKEQLKDWVVDVPAENL